MRRRISKRSEWGRWYLDEMADGRIFLCYQAGDEPRLTDYDCDLSAPTDWLQQVGQKQWATAEVMIGLSAALRDCAGKVAA